MTKEFWECPECGKWFRKEEESHHPHYDPKKKAGDILCNLGLHQWRKIPRKTWNRCANCGEMRKRLPEWGPGSECLECRDWVPGGDEEMRVHMARKHDMVWE